MAKSDCTLSEPAVAAEIQRVPSESSEDPTSPVISSNGSFVLVEKMDPVDLEVDPPILPRRGGPPASSLLHASLRIGAHGEGAPHERCGHCGGCDHIMRACPHLPGSVGGTMHGHLGLKRPFLPLWNDYYCRLHDGHLHLMRPDGTVVNSIDVRPSWQIQAVSSFNRAHCFKIIMRDASYVFCAPDEGMRTKWVEALRSVVSVRQ
eukprot:TRINITY_DN6098_c0_g1_i1.p1 TRINITY_DN6098_c0_g1~~TRINITY_DN6098_c0_g1_i1.p1  ORF type:complete len:205 (+),score=15.65 TRINITY_DN6098_c0_g1_i1:48-662(+)